MNKQNRTNKYVRHTPKSNLYAELDSKMRGKTEQKDINKTQLLVLEMIKVIISI